MRKVKSGKILLRDIKHLENSRLRAKTDVGELMHDIEQRGLLENIGVRTTDNALIFGNRRVAAFKKLGYSEIQADFFDDVSDEDLLIANLAENIKRKDIGSIEIGRICKILTEKGMTHSEISTKLGISKSRVDGSVTAYNVTVGTPFEKLVTFGVMGGHNKGIPETLIWKIQNSLSRARRGNKLSKEDWTVLLDYIEQGKLTGYNVTMLRAILLTYRDMSLEDALKILDESKIVYAYLCLNRKELVKAMRKVKIDNEIEFVKHIIKEYNEDLLF